MKAYQFKIRWNLGWQSQKKRAECVGAVQPPLFVAHSLISASNKNTGNQIILVFSIVTHADVRGCQMWRIPQDMARCTNSENHHCSSGQAFVDVWLEYERNVVTKIVQNARVTFADGRWCSRQHKSDTRSTGRCVVCVGASLAQPPLFKSSPVWTKQQRHEFDHYSDFSPGTPPEINALRARAHERSIVQNKVRIVKDQSKNTMFFYFPSCSLNWNTCKPPSSSSALQSSKIINGQQRGWRSKRDAQSDFTI